MKVTMLENESLVVEILGEPRNETKHIIIIHGDGSVGVPYNSSTSTITGEEKDE